MTAEQMQNMALNAIDAYRKLPDVVKIVEGEALDRLSKDIAENPSMTPAQQETRLKNYINAGYMSCFALAVEAA